MNDPTLHDLIDQRVLPSDALLLKIIEEGCHQPDSYLAVLNLLTRKVLFISAGCKEITGYEISQFIKGGMEFVFSITMEQSIPSILEAQRKYVNQIKKPGFDPQSALMHEYIFDIILSRGFSRRLISQAIALTYTKHADMEYGIAIVSIDNENVLKNCRKILVAIKQRHNIVFEQPVLMTRSEPLKRIFMIQQGYQKLTIREEEVLRLLAKGLTSSQIAKQLSIEENTVESHRKNILLKFEAKNIAELIKKASKVYWLE
jgi:DNA-binding CsgD family transcriptional regulator